MNEFVKYPERGDICVKAVADRSVHYVKLSNFDYDTFDQTNYEIIGVVARREHKSVLVVYKENASKLWCNRYQHKLTGYVLDGTAHTGVISIRESSSASANVDYTVSYNATTMEELCEQLNTFFDTTAITSSQDWHAFVEDGEVNIQYDYAFWQQSSYNTGKSGFAFAHNLMPEIKYTSNMRRVNGYTSGEGAISCMARALAYYRSDLSSATYNPASDITSLKRNYPVCLPAYLGTSQYQSDHCKFLRDYYGEGEEGWLKFMEAQQSVVSDYGAFIELDAVENTRIMSQKRMSSHRKNGNIMCLAADYVWNKSGRTFDAGEFALPSALQLRHIVAELKYNTTPNRNADELNAGLNAIKGTAISNGSNSWSGSRYTAGIAWYSYGTNGFFGSSSMGSSYLAVPTSLYTIA